LPRNLKRNIEPASLNLKWESEVQYRSSENIPRSLISSLLLLTVLAVSLFVITPTAMAAAPQVDSDQLFTQAVEDYNKNRFTDARAKFEKVQGAHAQEAQQYIARVKAYVDAMQVAKGIMDRSPDERDANSLEYAIQKFEEAIKIKPDGLWHPAEQLEKAKALKAEIDQKHGSSTKATDRTFCDKALAAAQEHHFQEAARFSCLLANDNPGYACGGDEAVHLCEQSTELAKMGEGRVSQSQQRFQTGEQPGALDRAKAAYDKNDFERARALFRQVSAENKPAADEYLDKISRYQDSMAQGEKASNASQYEEARTAFANAADIKADGPGDPRLRALRMELAEGLDQFYSGDYASATRHLETCARDSSEKQPMARFYLGASKLARFFITGSEDSNLRADALNDLKIAKQAGFKAEADISPKIMQAYKDLAF
jgi:tetratricopeptide (TPR) repeat protein